MTVPEPIVCYTPVGHDKPSGCPITKEVYQYAKRSYAKRSNPDHYFVKIPFGEVIKR